ncbi:hypothetical protein BH10PSE7_BH10PSE7_00810 [soil metagenome]
MDSPETSESAKGFAKPWVVKDKTGCWFYHCMDLPGESIETGTWDMRGRTSQYFGGVGLKGKSVLDVGTASGFLAFEAEKAGASSVVGYDAYAGRIREMIPIRDYRQNKERYLRELDTGMLSMKRGFWYSHGKLKSSVRAYYGSVYDIPEDVGDFDVAIIGQILVHLKHPLSCIEQVAERVKPGGHLIITEGTFDSPEPVIRFLWTPNNRNQTYSWWHISEEFFRRFLSVLDFELVSKSKAPYRLKSQKDEWSEYELPTFVFRRMVV